MADSVDVRRGGGSVSEIKWHSGNFSHSFREDFSTARIRPGLARLGFWAEKGEPNMPIYSAGRQHPG